MRVEAHVADLKLHQFVIEPDSWDLIIICYYLQRDLFEIAKRGLVPVGILLAIAHTIEPGEEPNAQRLAPGEMRSYFQDWQIENEYEGKPADPAHRRSVAEIVVRKPAA